MRMPPQWSLFGIDFKSFAPIVAIAFTLLIIPHIPSPLNFWLALGALLIGPGAGMPRILFPKQTLSISEIAIIITVSSIFLNTVAFASLNALGIPLTPITIGTLVLFLTMISNILASIQNRKNDQAVGQKKENAAWIFFICGLLLSVLLFLLVLYILM